MNRLKFSTSAWTGFVLALLGVGGLTMLTAFLPHLTALKIIICLVAGLYAAYIMSSSDAKIGRLLTPVAWLVITAVSFYTTSLTMFVLIQASFIWMVRGLYFHTGILAVGIDAVLTACSVGVGIWALATSNWMLALWSFFLVQSLAVWIPQPGNQKSDTSRSPNDFTQASANANAALRNITSSTS